jgi:DNA-binding LacI/PurR family transcriptional regulator
LAAAALLALPEPPTAIFAANDGMAYGVIGAAAEHGVLVPQGLAVVGFDDAAPSAQTHPPLSSVRQPFFEMGQRAAEALLALVELPHPRVPGWRRAAVPLPRPDAPSLPSQPVRIQLPTQLVVRESSGAPRLQVA